MFKRCKYCKAKAELKGMCRKHTRTKKNFWEAKDMNSLKEPNFSLFVLCLMLFFAAFLYLLERLL